jgi:4-amino-4-deoxy-L-arabinose transferase-like glycosyltransferase
MHNQHEHRQSAIKQEVIHLSVLLTIALCIGIYIILTTAVIATDGVKYIEYARNFDSDAIKTMLEEDAPPGYPVMLLGVQKVTGLFSESRSVFSWIYSAQSTSLVCRLLAIVMLYFIGKELVGTTFSFWAVLIIVLLPLPARYGSDALRDWPYLFFLATGFFLLLRAAISGKLLLFALAGITAGMGYLIRAECAQLIIYGSLWLLLQLFARKTSDWPKVAFAVVLLVLGFLVLAGPYIKLEGAVFPSKNLGRFALDSQSFDCSGNQVRQLPSTLYSPDPVRPSTAEALVKWGGNIGDTLEWFFVPAWIIGLYKSFRKTSLFEPRQFFVVVLIILNMILMLWLYTTYSIMDKRHTLPLVVFTIYYVPVGIEALASWLQSIRTRKTKRSLFSLSYWQSVSLYASHSYSGL